MGKHYGWPVHKKGNPQHMRKWDYEQVYALRDETGWGAIRLSRALGIPTITISSILAKERGISRAQVYNIINQEEKG